jgi:23S rRNA (pseudouridine1915-N3)-methyltransferase
LKLTLVAVGQRMPAWIDAGFDEYARRMPKTLPVRLAQVKPEPRGDGAPVARSTEAEAKRIAAALPAGCFKVVLDERGHACTTRELAKRISTWQMEGRDVAFVIGGADGVSHAVRAGADWLWSLSPLTLPHGLVRVVVAEQLYRASTILVNHPYHRE